ncbi:hypothetical protein BJX66DRAFT_297349 [Aspergillus keveii]|uniref:Integral membrane protein n=1 Tax=Aspergillus keveii TaxID=714993 RepID=A0ABR4GFK1_9EURO
MNDESPPRPPQRSRHGRSKLLQAHIICRALLFLVALTTLVIFIYVAVKFGPYDGERRYPVPISAAALALPFDPLAILSHIRGSTTVIRWTIGLDLIVAILAIVGGVTVLFTHYAGGGPDLRPYGFADIDGVPMAMAFVLGATRLIAMCMVCCCCSRCRRSRKGPGEGQERSDTEVVHGTELMKR